MADRFSGTADLISWYQGRGFEDRLRLKGNLVVRDGADMTTTGALARDRVYASQTVRLTAGQARTNIGIIHDPGHDEAWIIAMSAAPKYIRTLAYSQRRGIAPMFSGFK